MKYYIPSTTANFNNILSTESISPSQFYGSRGFGYKYFESVPPNCLKNRTLLYEAYPIFSIDCVDIESFPMVVEIESDLPGDSLIQKSSFTGVLFSEETIYLNPSTTRFIFRNEDEKRSACVSSTRSAETKLVDVYAKSFIVKTDNISEFEWTNDVDIPDKKITSKKYLTKDLKFNKMKGFLYGYIIGANRSVDDTKFLDAVNYINLLEDDLSDLINRPTANKAHVDQQCGEAYSHLDNILSKLRSTKVEELENERLMQFDKENKEKVISFLRDENLFEKWHAQVLESPELFFIRPFSGSSVSELSEYISSLRVKIYGMFRKERLNELEFPTIRDGRVESIPRCPALFTDIINELAKESSTPEVFASSRYDFALNTAKVFREYMGDQWLGSPMRKYINSLLKNLNEGTQFNINDSDQLLLQSFAAFCKKAEKDNLGSFYDYLISNGVGDVRMAFALWGAVFGFSAMPKTITNDLFVSADPGYLADVYEYVRKQLFSKNLPGEISLQPHDAVDSSLKDWITFRDSVLPEWNDKYKPMADLEESRLKCQEDKEFDIESLFDSSESMEKFFMEFCKYFKKSSTLTKALEGIREGIEQKQMRLDIEPGGQRVADIDIRTLP